MQRRDTYTHKDGQRSQTSTECPEDTEGVQYRAHVESDEQTDESQCLSEGLFIIGEKKTIFTSACGESCSGSGDFFDRVKSTT